MATASQVQLAADHPFQYRVPDITTQVAATASQLLQENHEQHHIFFNNDGFHNHIVHHLLTILALGSSPGVLKQQYDLNKSYQLPSKPTNPAVISALHDTIELKKRFGKAHHYHDFLVFFQAEIEKSGWQAVLQQYLFARDHVAEDLQVRLWAGFLHPIIHLGFGLEAEQPAIIAEALSQAAVHDASIGQFLKSAEEAARAHRSKPAEPIADLVEAIHNDPGLRDAPRWSDGDKIRDGIMARTGGRMLSYTARFHIAPSDLDIKTAEMINAVAYYTGGAQRDGFAVKFDFFLIHCLNSSIFFSTFLQQDWLGKSDKCRLLEWKVWMDLVMYASRKSPEIRLDIVRTYEPKKPSDWADIFERVNQCPDDGHIAKLVRALAHGQRVCAPYEGRKEFRVKHDDWLQLAHMAVDSVEAGEPHWVRSTGFDQAWEAVPRAQL